MPLSSISDLPDKANPMGRERRQCLDPPSFSPSQFARGDRPAALGHEPTTQKDLGPEGRPSGPRCNVPTQPAVWCSPRS